MRSFKAMAYNHMKHCYVLLERTAKMPDIANRNKRHNKEEKNASSASRYPHGKVIRTQNKFALSHRAVVENVHEDIPASMKASKINFRRKYLRLSIPESDVVQKDDDVDTPMSGKNSVICFEINNTKCRSFKNQQKKTFHKMRKSESTVKSSRNICSKYEQHKMLKLRFEEKIESRVSTPNYGLDTKPTYKCILKKSQGVSALKEFKCKVCSLYLPDESDIISHLLLAHIGNYYSKCEVCENIFSNKIDLLDHLPNHYEITVDKRSKNHISSTEINRRKRVQFVNVKKSP